jgi:hypothetical protein
MRFGSTKIAAFIFFVMTGTPELAACEIRLTRNAGCRGDLDQIIESRATDARRARGLVGISDRVAPE